ncbi:MAG: putative metallopeptidase [Candidatus Nanoarchaeia archaeon]|nr:putative metallopeptidase [Candidatus Nanoarchaeia archaeon]MDD5740822.1 putative metallopeptidase [Candidatus Nanoarchaeia archaeon]
MPIKYKKAEDLQVQISEIARTLFPHVRINDVVCLRSFGSTSRGTIARCHALGKAMQLALGRKGFYVIEVISGRFDRLSEEEKTKTLIHELMHIPKSFGGGFIHHNVVCHRNVEKMYRHYVNLKGRDKEPEKFSKKDIFQDNKICEKDKFNKEINTRNTNTKKDWFRLRF